MDQRRRGRVIVGVDDSVAGLRALREAAEQARRRGSEFHAVRTYVPTWSDAYSAPELLAADQSECTATMVRSFEQAMGGVPRDVTVRMFVGPGLPGPVLVDVADRQDDLLVVGATRRRPWWPWSRSTGGYCTDRASCPVLVVPPHKMAREMDGMWRRPWRWRRLPSVDTPRPAPYPR